MAFRLQHHRTNGELQDGNWGGRRTDGHEIQLTQQSFLSHIAGQNTVRNLSINGRLPLQQLRLMTELNAVLISTNGDGSYNSIATDDGQNGQSVYWLAGPNADDHWPLTSTLKHIGKDINTKIKTHIHKERTKNSHSRCLLSTLIWLTHITRSHELRRRWRQVEPSIVMLKGGYRPYDSW